MEETYTIEVPKVEPPSYSSISGVFKCFQCDYTCSTAVALKVHYQIHRSQDPFKCFQCGYEGTDTEDFRRHSLTHFEQSYYKCPKCNFKAVHRESITNHVKYVHKQICHCGEQFKVKTKFMWHLIQNPECKQRVELDPESATKLENFATRQRTAALKSPQKRPYKKMKFEDHIDYDETIYTEDLDSKSDMHICQICYFVFKSPSALKEHTASVHTEQRLNCSKCFFQCETEAEMSKHQFSHVEKLFVCKLCHFVFSDNRMLLEHADSHNNQQEGDVDYVCFVCDKSFNSERAVKLHMNHHSLVKHQCHICSVVLKSMSGYKNHMHMHNKKTYNCRKCHKQYNSEVGLKQHLATHTTKGYHWCPFCNFKTKIRAELRKHFRSLNHLRKDYEPEEFEEEFICFKCQYQTQTEEELQGHWFEEHNEDNQKCSECKADFETTEDLKEHLVIHYKPHKCEDCDESFCTAGILYKHSFIHRPEIALECAVCDSSEFETMDQLKDHAMNHYNDWKPKKKFSSSPSRKAKTSKKNTFKVKFTK